jgi:anti-sigma regulatory factor (Ser/Thr protein kinase)
VYEVRDDTLAQFSPLPLLLHICMEVPGLRRKSADIYTLLSELYTNALEHGVLDLSSDLKTSPDGFSYYYMERDRRLENVTGHFIRFALTHATTLDGGQLTITCEDSGRGFDHNRQVAPGTRVDSDSPDAKYSGRGLLLMQKLGHSLRYSEYGSRAEIVYDWEIATKQTGVGHE